jgi:shikimate kinase
MSRKYFFIGFMGSGKTTISRKLAAVSKLKWIDTDQEIEKEQGREIKQIFAEDGEDAFRDTETEYLRKIKDLEEDLIISCGGGIILREENIALMQEAGEVIYLKASPYTIFKRVRNSDKRPILNGHMNVEYISELMGKRLPYYEKAQTYTVSVNKKRVQDITEEILRHFELCLE